MQFYIFFDSISALLGRLEDDGKRLCAVETRLRLKSFPPQISSEFRIAGSTESALPLGLRGSFCYAKQCEFR